MVSSEAAPFAKTGGLADVCGALPAALARHGVEAAVVLPRYGRIELKGLRRIYDSLPVNLAGRRFETSIWRTPSDPAVFFVDCPPLYDRAGFYGERSGDYLDNDVRFAVLCRAALGVARWIFRPRILHGHDWQAGLLPVYLNEYFALDPTFLGVRTVFTIHNLGYQGIFGPEALGGLGLPRHVFHPRGAEFYGRVSLLKAGIAYADAITTVSPNYAREIQTPEYGFGMDGFLRDRAHALTGIVNGVDYAEWSPETDRHIAARYSADDPGGKAVCKRDLIESFGLPERAMERPLFGVVSRFAHQKGMDLIADIAGGLAAEDCYLIVLGDGDPEIEARFRWMAETFPDRIRVWFGYNNALSHKIEAGADLFLMPSRYEPCGLNQIYSLRYGTIPIVRATGGLDDTIDEGTGFKFWDFNGHALMGAVRAALAVWPDRERWTAMMRRAMTRDFSWDVSAGEYAALYRRLAEMNPSAPAAI